MAVVSLEHLPFQAWTEPAPSHLNFLNLDVYQIVMKCLGHEFIATLSLTSKTFYNLTNNPQVLRFLLRSVDKDGSIPRTLIVRIFRPYVELVSKAVDGVRMAKKRKAA